MKAKKISPIVRKLYTFSMVNSNNEIMGMGCEKVTYTQYASFCVKNSDVKEITPHLELIARQNKIDLMNYSQFEYAFDKLRQAVSWN